MLQENIEWFGAIGNTRVTVTENLGNVTFIHTDGLGSPVARTDAAGQVIAGSRTRYEPYGYVASGATPTIGFTGHVNDADTGLTYMQQRYYDPVAGKFLSIDPVVTDVNNGGSFNRYGYANNSPYQYVDPDGRAVESITMDKNRNVHIVMGMSYRGITAQQAASLNAGIIAKWSGKFGPYTVRMTIIPGSQAKFGNIVTIKSGTGLALNNGNNGREATLYSKDPAGNSLQAVLNHEVGHMIGMNNVPADRYHPLTHVPLARWEGNIMADADGKVDETNIHEIVTNERPYLPSSATAGTGPVAQDSLDAGSGYTCRNSGTCFN